MPEIPDGLPSIGKATKVLLATRGIESAFDVWKAGPNGHEGLPGLGPAKWAVLHDWACKHLDIHDFAHVVQDKLGEPSTRSNYDHWMSSDRLHREVVAQLQKSTALSAEERQSVQIYLDNWIADVRPRIQQGQAELDAQRAERERAEQAANTRIMLTVAGVIGVCALLCLGLIAH